MRLIAKPATEHFYNRNRRAVWIMATLFMLLDLAAYWQVALPVQNMSWPDPRIVIAVATYIFVVILHWIMSRDFSFFLLASRENKSVREWKSSGRDPRQADWMRLNIWGLSALISVPVQFFINPHNTLTAVLVLVNLTILFLTLWPRNPRPWTA